jgi:hypothetical protein
MSAIPACVEGSLLPQKGQKVIGLLMLSGVLHSDWQSEHLILITMLLERKCASYADWHNAMQRAYPQIQIWRRKKSENASTRTFSKP